jgi:Zn-dependent protease
MKAQFTIGRLGGIPISIHWTFLVLLVWVILINIFSVSQTDGVVWSILLFFSLFTSIFAHELGHAIMARFFGARISAMVLLPTGAVSSYRALPKKRGQELLILIAGPLVNLFLAALFSFFINPFQAYWNAPETIGNASQSNFLFQWQILNLSLFFFNLIPAFPLDGGGILKVLLSYKMESGKATHIAYIVSNVIGYGLIAAGIIWINLLFILLGAFILLTCGTARKHYAPLKTITKRFTLQS